MPEAGPLLAAALLCERVIEDKEGVLSIIRIVDNFTVSRTLPVVAPPPDSTPVIVVTLLVSFKAGQAKGTYQVESRLRAASGKPLKGMGEQPNPSFTFSGEQPEQGANIVINAGVPANEPGLYYFDILLDGSPVTSVPFRIREQDRTVPQPLH
jgi:hypothetical protein